MRCNAKNIVHPIELLLIINSYFYCFYYITYSRMRIAVPDSMLHRPKSNTTSLNSAT